MMALNGGLPVNCCEFLVRMRAPDNGGLILPGAFIPAAERFGLMPALDRWVVGNGFSRLAACRNAKSAAENGDCGRRDRANLSIIRELDIVHGHIFPYSPRPGTPAARMPPERLISPKKT